MKRKLFTLVLAASALVSCLTGCSKNADKPGNPGISTKDKIVGSYKLTELTLVQQEGTTDVLAHMNSCDKDNLFVFKADMTSAVIDAGEQCDPSSGETGTWSLPDDNTLVLNGTTLKIKSLDGTTLKLSGEYSDEEVEGTVNVTYVKQ